MSDPRAVDSEVTFRDGNCSSARGDEDTPESDAEVAYGSQHVPDEMVRAQHEHMSTMASVLRDVVGELKQLNEAGRGTTSSTANNENNNTCAATVHRRVRDLDYDLHSVGDCRNYTRVGNRVPDVRELQPEPQSPRFLNNDFVIDRNYERQTEQGQPHAQPWVSNTRCENARGRYEYQAPVYMDGHRPNQQRRLPPVKMASFSGKQVWVTWISQFEAIAKRNNWSQDEMLDQLLPRLEGLAAQFVFSQLSPNLLNDYQSLVEELDSRFRVIETPRSFASKFSRRSQRHGETLEEYAAELKQLYDKAHGWRDRRTRDEDLVRRFLDELSDDDVKFEVEFNKEPRNIDEAVYFAVNLIEIRGSNRAERRSRYNAKRTENDDYDGTISDKDEKAFAIKETDAETTSTRVKNEIESKSQASTIKELLARIVKLECERNTPQKRNFKTDVTCFRCQQKGHYARECPNQEQKNAFNRTADEKQKALNGKGPALAAKGRSM
ncbi:hypothetical protein DPMN_180042 [Dreissena polymorpha]|uniref:CCHC-type domain-containing protein n=1 Tax=Dreissena polymorpha TaxID=45954 RepID=A0A9D4EI88_DREPO|nr:hypothetical protein DPMN_180042 [Dreissena polymorpha]